MKQAATARIMMIIGRICLISFFLNDVWFVDFRGVNKQSQNTESVGLHLDWSVILTSSYLVFSA